MNYLNLFPLRLSTTQDFELYNRCPYLWLKLRCEYWTKYSYNIHLEFGKEFASALQTTRVAYYKDLLPAREAINLGLNQILDTFAVTFQEDNGNGLKTPAKMQEVFERYFVEFPLDYDIVPFILANGELSVEQSFDIELPFEHPELGIPLIISAKPDIIGYDNRDIIHLKDEKTASQSGLTDVIKTTNKYRVQNQGIQYVTLINRNNLLGEGRKITQMGYRRIPITKTKLSDRSGAIPKNSVVVEEYSFTMDAWYQEEWWQTTLLLVEEMLIAYKKHTAGVPRAFNRRYGNCEKMFQPCELTMNCSSGSAQDLERNGYVQMYRDKDTGEERPMREKRIKLGLPV
jgi:hypothetical protein